jgi:nucleotide-binding universal stress UspA family protein
MIKTILVPLDGSANCEHALAIAACLAKRAKAALRLVHVRQTMPDQVRFATSSKEQDYLDLIAWRIRQTTHISVYATVIEGPIAETIAEHARSVGATLIVMTTHGRGPFSRFWLGGVADQLIRRAPAFLIVVRPPEDECERAPSDSDWKPRRILVALDGSTFAEAILQRAVELAKLLSAELTLVRVIEPTPVLTPNGLVPQPLIPDSTGFDELKTQARTYLEGIADNLRKDGLSASCRVLVDDRVAPAILEEGHEFDLMALATHARHGISRMLLGSVTDKLVRGATRPVLVVPPQPH